MFLNLVQRVGVSSDLVPAFGLASCIGMHQASDDVFPKDSLESLVKAHEGQAFLHFMD